MPRRLFEGYFNTEQMPWVKDRLKSQGLVSEGTELLIKRMIQKNGRSRVYINGELATLNILQRVCEGLIDLCGQHEHQALLKPGQQMLLLDRYGGLEKKVEKVAEALHQRRTLLEDQKKIIWRSGEPVK